MTAYTTGTCVILSADTKNTGAATVNIDGLGAKSILGRNGNALKTNDIEANIPVTICYNGTNYYVSGDGIGTVAAETSTQGVFGTTCATEGVVNFTTDSQMLQRCNGATYDNYGLLAPKSVPSTGWSWNQQGTGQTATFGNDGLTLYSPVGVEGMYDRAYTTNQECIVESRLAIDSAAGFPSFGLSMRSVSPNRATIAIVQNNASAGGNMRLAISRITTNPLAGSSTPLTTGSILPNTALLFWKATYDGTTVRWFWGGSQTGPWAQIWSETAATWLTSGPTFCGFYLAGGSAGEMRALLPYISVN